MGKGFNNWYLRQLNETVLNNEWMSNLYGSRRVDQQKELKRIFTQISDNDATTEEKEVLGRKAESVQETVERLEAKMAVLCEALAKNQAELDKHAKAVVNLVAKADSQAQKLEAAHMSLVERAVADSFYYLKKGDLEPDEVTKDIEKRIKGNSSCLPQAALDATLKRLDGKQAEVANIVTEADKWVTQRNILEAQYGATKSTYDLLNATASKIGNNSGSYTNSDFDTVVPTYSPEKVALISKYSQNPMINLDAGANTAYVEGAVEPSSKNIESVKEKYEELGLLKPERTKNSASYENDAVKVLGQALEAGLIDDLAAAGLDVNEAQDFLVENFEGAYIVRTDAGLMNVPPGHDEKSAEIYDSLVEQIKNYGSSFQTTINIWNPEKGNTIGSNKQIASLAENYELILKDMKDNGFTFKEAMYAMFDSEYGIFKESGVVYDANKQGENPNYFVTAGGDEETAKMYQGMAQLIYENWGVKPFTGAKVEEYNPEYGEPTSPSEPEPEMPRTDPLSFSLDGGNNVFSFIIDRNKDGSFDGKNEFVGADSQTSWLDDMKSFDKNADGVISGEELDNVMLLNTKFSDDVSLETDNNEYTPDKVASEKEYERKTQTNIDYKLISASKLGIESIDLSQLTNETSVNVGGGNFDANGSEIFDDSFTFIMKDGTEITAKRKDETTEYMDKVYGSVYGKATKLGFGEEYVQNVMNKDYADFDKFIAKYQDVFDDINVLKNVGSTASETRKMAQRTQDAMKEHQGAQLMRAQYRAQSFKNVSSWTTGLRDDVIKEMNQPYNADLPKDDEHLESVLEGIHVVYNLTDPKQIVEKYREQLQDEERNKDNKETNREAWKSLVKVTQAGIAASADEIKELLESGQAKTADDVLRILSEIKQGANVETDVTVLEFDSEREQEIFDAFNKVFNEAGLNNEVVDALQMLCELQQANPKYMLDKTGEQLAKDIMSKMQKK